MWKKNKKKNNVMSNLEEKWKLSNLKNGKQRITWTPNDKMAKTLWTWKTLSNFKKNWSKKKWNVRYQKIVDVRSQDWTQEDLIPRNCVCIDSRNAKNIVRFQGREQHCPISDSCSISDFARKKHAGKDGGRTKSTKSPKQRTQDP